MTSIGRGGWRVEQGARSREVFGEPYETADGATIITVTRVGGGPFGASPLGIFVIRDGAVTWETAVDVNRLALFGEFIGFAAAVIATLTVFRRPPWPDLSAAGMEALRKLKWASR
ncbi:hypothetical protein DFR70_113118 [Nocardia tenerifensis]|uniref:Uncharacterized protein n=1 Tax=Nocardia tenerifensis TaxID=228006 RepID=A0A318JX56_9NOCA|nr:hypothetical protein [Nocardia tenerifensis]PXX58783.1 hypothetical protein DFR70_113118 [Nocardia tenerifensis]